MRKFVLTLAALPAVLLAGCKQESNYNNITLDKYALEMRTGDTQFGQLVYLGGDFRYDGRLRTGGDGDARPDAAARGGEPDI